MFVCGIGGGVGGWGIVGGFDRKWNWVGGGGGGGGGVIFDIGGYWGRLWVGRFNLEEFIFDKFVLWCKFVFLVFEFKDVIIWFFLVGYFFLFLILGLLLFCLIEFEDFDLVVGGGCLWLFKRLIFLFDIIVSWWISVIKDLVFDLEYFCFVFVISVFDFDDFEDCVEDSFFFEDFEIFFFENCFCLLFDKIFDLFVDECDSFDEKDEVDFLLDGDRKILGDFFICDFCCLVVFGIIDFVVVDDIEWWFLDIGGGGGWELGLFKDFFWLNFILFLFLESEFEICIDGKVSGEMREIGGGGGGVGRDLCCCCNFFFDFCFFIDIE